MEHEHSYFQTFRETCRVLTSTLDIGEVIQLIARLTAEAARVKGCTIRLLNEKERRLNLIASHGLSERYLQKGPIDVDRSLTESTWFETGATTPRRISPNQEEKNP